MKYCNNCQHPLEDDVKFCPNCGAQNALQPQPMAFCTNCGNPMAADSQFCTCCGRPAGVGQQMPQTPAPAPRKKGKSGLIIAIVVLVLALVVGACWAFGVFGNDPIFDFDGGSSSSRRDEEEEEEDEEDEEEQEETDEPTEAAPEAYETEPEETTLPAVAETEPVIGGELNQPVEITLWTYPIGSWSNPDEVERLIADFQERYPNIRVKVHYVNYTSGDSEINAAIEAGVAPDLVFESPERICAIWAKHGVMADLSDLMDSTDRAEIYSSVQDACTGADGNVYMYPLAMTTFCMAINKTVFEAAGAMQYIDEETHTWKSVDAFFAAVETVYAYTGTTVGAVFCGGQGGDQGTRALVNNLYGGRFTDEAHTRYTWASEENAAALAALMDCPGIEFDKTIVGGDEIGMFYEGKLNMAFCWNIAQQLNPYSADTGSGLTASGDEILFLTVPSDTQPRLCGGVWGFGVFDNGDEAKIRAAKLFISFMCDSEETASAVQAAAYFPVRETVHGVDLTEVWANNPIMMEYSILMPLLGDYYQVTPNWAMARTAWWNMLQAVADGTAPEEALAMWETYPNGG